MAHFQAHGFSDEGRSAFRVESKVGRASREDRRGCFFQLFAFCFQLAALVLGARRELGVLSGPLGELLRARFQFLELRFLDVPEFGRAGEPCLFFGSVVV